VTHGPGKRNPAVRRGRVRRKCVSWRNSTFGIAPYPEVMQARIELLREEIIATVSPLSATLEAALAMSAISDDAGLIYALRTAKAYWQCASANAAELVELRGAPR
jgi:hypothetical protein